MELIRSGAGSHEQTSAGCIAVLGGIVRGVDLDFRNGFQSRSRQRPGPVAHIGILNAVHLEARCLLLLAIESKPSGTVEAGAALVAHGPGSAWHQLLDLSEFAAVDRQIGHLLCLDGVTQVGGFGVDQRGGIGNGHRFRRAANLKLEIESEFVANVELDCALDLGLEALSRGGDVIDSDQQVVDLKDAVAVGHGGAHRVSPHVLYGDRHFGNDVSAGVRDAAGDASRRLRAANNCEKHDERAQSQPL